MLEQLLILVALLSPSVIITDQTPADQTMVDQTLADQPDGSDKDLCYDLGSDPVKCSIRSDICFWDSSDQRCEWIIDPQHCTYYPHYVCVQSPDCFWDTSDNRCERL